MTERGQKEVQTALAGRLSKKQLRKSRVRSR